jgi:hypothetical protein
MDGWDGRTKTFDNDRSFAAVCRIRQKQHLDYDTDLQNYYSILSTHSLSSVACTLSPLTIHDFDLMVANTYEGPDAHWEGRIGRLVLARERKVLFH